MTDQGKKYLTDIIHAIDLIESFSSDISTYDEYVADLKTQSAVERQLGIIGEAILKFEKIFPDSILNNARKIVGFRNRLIHAYDAVDPSIIWAILKKHLEPLKQEVGEKLQSELPGKNEI